MECVPYFAGRSGLSRGNTNLLKKYAIIVDKFRIYKFRNIKKKLSFITMIIEKIIVLIYEVLSKSSKTRLKIKKYLMLASLDK